MQLIVLSAYALASWFLWESAGVSDRIDQLMEHGLALSRPSVMRLSNHRDAELTPIVQPAAPIVKVVQLRLPACEPVLGEFATAKLPCPEGGLGYIEIEAERCTNGGIRSWRLVANACGEA